MTCLYYKKPTENLPDHPSLTDHTLGWWSNEAVIDEQADKTRLRWPLEPNLPLSHEFGQILVSITLELSLKVS